MARLATLIAERGLFIPLLEHIMTDPKDHSKPGLFLDLFPHPLSRLYLALLWKINSEQDGDAVVLSNVWLRGFANLHNDSLLQYRKYLDVKRIIRATRIAPGREYLYRVAGSDGRALSDESDMGAIDRLGNPERIKEAARARVMKRYRRRTAVEPPISPPEQPTIPSSWDQ